ncbi:VanZ family protein [Streptomyces sp. NPDC094048]|uniref:VanZ family protein n=1 Tax=unclassified Streptomyces TaxID=2593676 RepID=UPI00331E6FF2
MVSAILHHNTWLIQIFLILGVLLSFATVRGTRSIGSHFSVSILFGWSLAGILAAKLSPSYIESSASGDCVVDRDFITPLSSAQGLMNIAFFAPATFFMTLISRRPIETFVFGVLLSAGLETVQATAPFIGRSCDSGDLAANSIGAAAGVALAFLSSLLEGWKGSINSSDHPWRTDASRSLRVAAIGGVAINAIGFIAVTPIPPEVGVLAADSPQSREGRKVVGEILGKDQKFQPFSIRKQRNANPE